MKHTEDDKTSIRELERELKKIRMLSGIAFKSSDIRSCSITINPENKEDLSDAVVTLYTWDSCGESDISFTWDVFINAFHPEDILTVCDDFRELIRGNISELKMEVRIKKPEAPAYRWRELTASVYERNEENRPVVIFTCSTDIHERKSQELNLEEAISKAEKADKMKSKYLADMSHEIRTPLNAITGFAELMAFTDSDEERMAYYDVIKTNNQMLMQLINDILDLSKIEADVVQISYESVDINDIIDSAYASTRLRLPKGVELKLEKECKEYLFGTDPVRLLQLITNLANNAIKHTPNGSITIGYSVLPEEKLRFFVRDTGLGIPEEKQKQLFGRFAKVNDYAEGIGLGLAICQGLITKMGGTLEVESKVGVGSEFSFILPSRETTREI